LNVAHFRPRATIIARDFKAVTKNSLRGFVTLILPSGLVIHDCSLHEKDGRRWIGLPGKPQLDRDGRQRKDANGKPLFIVILEIEDRNAKTAFQRQALAAVDALLGTADDVTERAP
jgi:hypothetical protein